MDTTVIEECKRLSFADTPFPEVVKRLAGAGVRTYRADLLRLRADYYGADDEACETALPLAVAPRIGERFDALQVATVVRTIQQGEIGYADFLRRIMEAGCASYVVHIGGRRVIYCGRDGDCHVEHFPPAPPS